MDKLEILSEKIKNQTACVGVVGLGYVGLPVAVSFGAAGFNVIGVDIKKARVACIRRGENPIEGNEPGLSPLLADVVAKGKLNAFTEYDVLSDADIILIDVETPVGEDHIPVYHALQNACSSLGSVLKKGALVIIESTVAPGTVEGLVAPLLSKTSGFQLNEDFFLGACPERVMPGKLLSNLAAMSRVCGGGTPETALVMQRFYRKIVRADLDLADIITAELTKTTENAYRDVQIAFANEVAKICEANGADLWKVRELVNKSPGRHMLYPGAGVGGHCIPKDPWLLAHAADGHFEPVLIPAAREVNSSMPGHMISLIEDGLTAVGMRIPDSVILVLGYAYLEESDDTRNSPSEVLVETLVSLGAEVRIHDPWVAEYKADLWALVKGADAVVLMVAHEMYHQMDLKQVLAEMTHPVVIDGRHVIDVDPSLAGEIVYRCIGIGQKGD